jgi:hypothetical protein
VFSPKTASSSTTSTGAAFFAARFSLGALTMLTGCDVSEIDSVQKALRAVSPQTILATKYAGEIIGDPFGYPLRLRTSTKLGYKNAKWIKAIEVTNDFRETYWSERGFNRYAGI